MRHFVYRVTAKIPQNGMVYYVGKHSGELDDLHSGKYKTSSKILRKDFKPENFKIKIVKIFENSNDAVRFEIKYHKRLKVSTHPKFFNLAIQTSKSFDRGGMVTVFDTLENVRKTIPVKDFKDKNRYVCIGKGFTLCKNLKTQEVLRVSNEEFKNNPNLVGINHGVVYTKDLEGNRVKISKLEYKQNKSKYKHEETGKTIVWDKEQEKFVKISTKEFKENKSKYQGANTIKGFDYVPCKICGKLIQYPNLKSHETKGHNGMLYVRHNSTMEVYLVENKTYFEKYTKDYSIFGGRNKNDYFGKIDGKEAHIRYLGKALKDQPWRILK